MLNFFKKKDKPPAAPADEERSTLDDPDPELEAAAMAAAEGDDEGEDAFEREWTQRARAVIPGGASTGSKRAAALWGEGVDAHGPTHFVHAHGCEVTTIGEREFID